MDKEEIVDKALLCAEYVVFGGAVFFAVVGATFMALAGITIAGVESIKLTRLKEEGKNRFSLQKLKDMFASGYDDVKAAVYIHTQQDGVTAPIKESEVCPLFRDKVAPVAVDIIEVIEPSDSQEELGVENVKVVHAEGENSTAQK